MSRFTALFGEQTAEVADSSGFPGNLGLGNFVSGNYFTALGVEMALGRAFAPEEDQMPGAPPEFCRRATNVNSPDSIFNVCSAEI